MIMEAIATQIRSVARRLLKDRIVDVVIGYANGTILMREYPYFAYTVEEAKNLTWTSFCCNNLALYTTRHSGRMAIVAQGCVTRNLIGLIQENQVKREDLYILGVNSQGMLDRRRIQALVPGKMITKIEEQDDFIIIKGMDFTQLTVKRSQVMRQNCYTCLHRNPVIYDELLGIIGSETYSGNLDVVAGLWEKLASEQRWQKFTETVKNCIRCYACRDVCPLCYCKVCFVDDSRPQWCGKTNDEDEVKTFHLMRAFHCAGRCTDCGACESACPMGINMRCFTMKLEKDIRQLYGYESGMTLDQQPPMTVYRPNDPQDFIY